MFKNISVKVLLDDVTMATMIERMYSMFRGVIPTFISQLRLSPEVQLQASSHNYKGIIFIQFCKVKWFHLYSVIPMQS